MELGKAIILGIVQGLTEFLPVSSSGHLVLGKYLLGLSEQGIEFEVIVHFGTLMAVLTAFYKDIFHLLKAFGQMFTQGPATLYKRSSDFRMIIYIIIATIPTAIIGLLFEEKIETLFSDPKFACSMLIVTAAILFLTMFARKQDQQLSGVKAFLMGLAQTLAILPGISRSGSTISMGLFLKIDGNTAARFSFLMAIPAILGATVLKVSALFQAGISPEYFASLIAGMLAAYISGYLAIESMLGIVRKGKLFWFAPYCLIVGIIGLIFI